MAQITGLFQRGSSYYLRVVLPNSHPLRSTYRNGRYVVSLGAVSRRSAVLKATVRRAEVLGGFRAEPQVASIYSPITHSSLLAAYDLWANAKPRSKDTKAACLRAVTLAHSFTEHTPIENLTRRQGTDFVAWLQHVDRETTSKTARDRLIWVKSLLEFAAQDLGMIRRSPWTGLDIYSKTTNKRRPWLEHELATLFLQPLHTCYSIPYDNKAGGDAAYWIPLLGLYTGARVGELAQLRTEDIGEVDGFPMLSITDEGEHQQVKTSAGLRRVPLHPELIRLGFLDYVTAIRLTGAELLWPALPTREGKPGGYFSQWFGTYRRSLGFGKYPDFHCFRHTVRSQLAAAGIAEAVIDTLVGHEVSGSVGAKVYTHRSPQTLADAIGCLSFPAAVLQNVYRIPFPLN